MNNIANDFCSFVNVLLINILKSGNSPFSLKTVS